MPTVATAEPKNQARNQSLQDNAAVLDTPEKENLKDGAQSTPENSPAPNPVSDISMSGNPAAAPVIATSSSVMPMQGAPNATAPVMTGGTAEIETEEQKEDQKKEKGEKKSSSLQTAGEGGDSGDSPSDSGSPSGGADGAAPNNPGESPAGEEPADQALVEKEAEGKGEKKGEKGEEKEKSGKASGSSVLDFQASGKAMDKEGAKPTVTNPEKDPAFKGVVQHTDAVKEEQNTHLPSGTKLAETTAATPLTDVEQSKKNDQLGHLGAMNQIAESEDKKKEPFTPEKFKKLLQGHLTELSKQMPDSKDKAKEFKKNKPVEAVKEKIAADVKSENEKLSGPMVEQAKQPEPPKSGVPATPAVVIPEEKPGPAPTPIDPVSAVPKEKSASELSMEKESKSLDDAMDANNVTDEQLANSNEPKFLEAKQSKDDAQEQAAAAPGNFKGIEKKKLADAKKAAEKRGDKGLSDMHIARTGALGNVLSTQETTGDSDQEKQKQIYAKLETIYTATKDAVKLKLDGLSEKVDTMFSTQAEQAKKTFEENVEERLDDIYGFTVIDDWLFGEDTEAIEEAFRIEKGKFERTMNGVIDSLATIIADELNATIEVIKKGKKASEEYFNSLDKDQQKLAGDAFDNFNDQYDTLEETVYEKQDELAQDLASSYKENVDSLRESFDAIKESVSAGWIGAAFNFIAGVIDTILKIKDLLLNLLSAVIDAIGAILSDPIGFLSNLINGIVQGFTNFKNNILNNIMTGLIEWLTGSLGNVGIKIPKDLFSLGGIFDLVAQILGLTWDYFREKAVKVLGEPVVKAMETGFEIFMIIKDKGIEGLWEYVKEQFNDLQEMVMDAIRDMIITKVIEAGVKWIMGLMSPAGAFIKAAMMIIDIARFFIERAAQIIELVSAFVDGIRALASGNVAAVAKAVEKALVKAIPILIGFLAALVGITGLTGKVQKIIKRVRKRIDKAINKIIKKGKKAFGKLLGKKKGEKVKAKDVKEDDKKSKSQKEHDEKVKLGLEFLKKEEKKHDEDKDKKLTEEEAIETAKRTKKKHPIFKSITPKKKGKKWVYAWKASSGETTGSDIEDEELTPFADRIQKAQSVALFRGGFHWKDWKNHFGISKTVSERDIKWGRENGKILPVHGTRVSGAKPYSLNNMDESEIISISVKQVRSIGRDHPTLKKEVITWTDIRDFNVANERLPNDGTLFPMATCNRILDALFTKDVLSRENPTTYKFVDMPPHNSKTYVEIRDGKYQLKPPYDNMDTRKHSGRTIRTIFYPTRYNSNVNNMKKEVLTTLKGQTTKSGYMGAMDPTDPNKYWWNNQVWENTGDTKASIEHKTKVKDQWNKSGGGRFIKQPDRISYYNTIINMEVMPERENKIDGASTKKTSTGGYKKEVGPGFRGPGES